MKRLRWLIALTSVSTIVFAGAGAFAAVAGASRASAGRTSASRGRKIDLIKTSLGKILGNSKGFTIYMFTSDRRNHDNCVKHSGCPRFWPLVTTSAMPVAGPGVKQALLGTIVVNAKKQVTYAGHPLYMYSGDSAPRQTEYVNFSAFGGRWPAINAAGHKVT
jgi:predicted lipoprotein with Yx(FWY)xxD motif